MRIFGSAKRTGAVATPPPVSRRGAAEAFLGQTFLGKYRTRRFLGEGSNAHVFLADTAGGGMVVVKRIKDEAAQASRFRQFFDAEVRSMSGFVHPYVCRLLDASLDDPLGPCLVLEHIDGVTLETVLDVSKKLTPERAARLLGPLAHALVAAQKRGICHRDLKPANLMVVNPGTGAETVKVMDFGFAAFTTKPHIQLAELTGHGSIFACGTPAYVSPEMVRGDTTDARSDIYSVGVIAFELLTGRLPFDHDTQEELLAAHVREQPPKFHEVGAGQVPPAVEAAVQMALAKYANERPPTMREFIDLFSRGLGWDVWKGTAPPTPDADIVALQAELPPVAVTPPPVVAGEDDAYVLSDTFEACLPEKLAALKLKGFIDDVKGHAVESEPGLIRVRVEMPVGWKAGGDPPSSRSGVFGFLSGAQRPPARGKEPIEIELRMDKLDPNRVAVLVCFRPLPGVLPTDPRAWRERCEGYYSLLRKFVMPGG